MNAGLVVGIAGGKNAGKDMTSDFLCTTSGWYFKKEAFATFLKEMCKFVFGLTEEQVGTQEGKESLLTSPQLIEQRQVDAILLYCQLNSELKLPRILSGSLVMALPLVCRTPREVLQRTGDVARLAYGADFFARIVVKYIEMNRARGSNTVVSDVRYPQERQALRDVGAKLVYIINPDEKKMDLHSSENSFGEMSEYNLVTTNDKKYGTKEVLRIRDEILNLFLE
jgi:hypothetical protein